MQHYPRRMTAYQLLPVAADFPGAVYKESEAVRHAEVLCKREAGCCQPEEFLPGFRLRAILSSLRILT